ncbi:MAG: tetratricopeptide repeat protein [Candidatus Bruticola sp.]
MSSKKLTSRQYAEQLLERSHREPNNVDLHISIGEACLRNGDTDGAFKAFNRAAELDPNSYFRSLVYEWSGYINKKGNQISEAITAYTQWAQTDRVTSYPLDRWGAILAQENMAVDLFLLRSMYKKRLEQNPDDPELLASLALLSFVLGDNAIDEETSLLQLASNALEAEYDSLPMRYLMGLLYMRIAHFDSADSEFEKVLELDSEGTWREYRFALDWSSESAMLMRARIAHIQKNYDKALSLCFLCILQLHKLNPFLIFEEMISIKMEQEDYAGAVEIFTNMVPDSIAKDTPPSLLRMLARCLLGIGQIDAAVRFYEFEKRAELGSTAQSESEEDDNEEDDSLKNDSEEDDNLKTPSQDEITAAVARTSLEADLLCDSGEYDKALESWQKLDAAYPDIDIPEVYLGKSKIMSQQKKHEDAIKILEYAVGLLGKQTKNIDIWNQLAILYKKSDQTLKYRLARIQIQSLTPQEEEPFSSEIIAVPPSSFPIIALGISARSMEGSGNIKITGTESVASAMEIAWTYLRSEARSLGLPDPNSYDIHIHIRDISFDINKKLNTLSEYLGTYKLDENSFSSSEELGLAFLLAMVSALTGSSGGNLCVVGGRIDLQGRIYSSTQLASGLQRMYESGVRWKRLILPRSINAEMEHIPQSVWSTPNLSLCSNARQAIKAWLLDS